ncbi:hypothetical protein S40288_03766 [Stachybotrys chartarum IBT 40288]|nr:hypothetical protein S40288_03766 [Stachybotrys chartarum IBT 40288]
MESLMESLKKSWPPNLPTSMPEAYANRNTTFPLGLVDSFILTASQASPILHLILFIYRLLGSQFGLDPTVLLTLIGFGWAMSKVFSQVYDLLESFFDHYFACSVSICERDHIYNQVVNFLSEQPSVANHRSLTAQTVWKSAWDEEEDSKSALSYTDGGWGDGQERYLNFANQAAQSNPRFIPAMGSSAIWHNGTRFKVYRKKESYVASGWEAMKDLEEVTISCYGRSTYPIKRLLADAKAHYYHDTHRKTAIYRPRSKEQRSEHSVWQQVARRPFRPMHTVVLASKQKHEILNDINEYLHPATPKWYASRGIPLRRGYLFHGPPGTGKTSFSFALAGVFGIDIYVISLQDANVTEEEIALLFTKLPRRCIILLEDIDTAGLKRDVAEEEDKPQPIGKGEKKDGIPAAENGAEEKKHKRYGGKAETEMNGSKKESKPSKKKRRGKAEASSSSEESDDSGDSSDDDEREREKTRQRKRRLGRGRMAKGGGKVVSVENISLSGLLNAIDGVASHEGRILIMTTNKPESLDEALIRPGRVDLQVAFTNATSQQAGELFRRMYELETEDPLSEEKMTIRMEPELNSGEIGKIADDFAAKIPEEVFSPAEIQGFLLKRKKTPRKALEDAPAWIEATQKQKEAKSKVVTVQ